MSMATMDPHITQDNGNSLARSEQAPAQPSRWTAGVGQRGIVLSCFSDLWKMANAIAVSGLAPKNMNRAETIFVALEMGLEVGLAPMAAIRSIAVINGRPAIYGDAALALVRASGFLETFEERIEGSGDSRRAICVSKRKGMPVPRTTTFSVSDARAANIWGKEGPWRQYPDRMLQFRARGFNLRDEFGDVLNGMVTAEEAQDIPPENGGGTMEPPARGVKALVQKLTNRPVSEGQEFVPDPGAMATMEAEPPQKPEAAVPVGRVEVDDDITVTRTEAVEQGDEGQRPPLDRDAEIDDWLSRDWADVKEAIWAAHSTAFPVENFPKATRQAFDLAIGGCVVKVGLKGKEDDIPLKVRRSWYDAAVKGDGRFGYATAKA